MNRTAFVLPMVLVFILRLHAEPYGRFGLGVIAGEPTGVAAKFWVGSRSGLDGAVAWSFIDEDRVQVHLDYQFHLFPSIRRGYLSFFFGGGGVIRAWGDDVEGGVRIPGGALYRFGGVPIGVFVEAAPRMEFIPETKWGISVAGGAYYFFGGTRRSRSGVESDAEPGRR